MTDQTKDPGAAVAPDDYVPARPDQAKPTNANADLDEDNLADAPKALRVQGIGKVTWRTAGFDKSGKRTKG